MVNYANLYADTKRDETEALAVMSYRKNWARHLIAPLTGEGLSNVLAKDFWRDSEDLWDAGHSVGYRWVKLFWVYTASAVAQVGFPLIIALTVASMFKPIPLRWMMICAGGASAFGMVFAMFVATATYFDVTRKRNS